MIFLFLNLGGGEILVIALFVLMFFGSKQIPELMRGLGRATREFKDAMGGIEREVRSATQVDVMEEKKSSSDTDSKKIPASVPPEGTQQASAMNQHVNDGPPVE
jgi:sec-independent protein translocase protein TatA